MLHIKVLIDIIKSVLNGQEFVHHETFEQVDPEQLYAFSKAHHLAGFVACCPKVMQRLTEEMKKKFRYELNIAIAMETAQSVTIAALLDKMEQAGLRAMPLKGYFIKELYPIPALRYMTDTDILIDAEKLGEIKPIMESLGFSYDHDSVYETIYKSPQLAVELHKSLVESGWGSLYKYFCDGWSKAKKAEGKEYIHRMSPEDMYVFTVAHIAKHYFEGGIGIKHVMDIYVQNRQQMDFEYIKAELEKLELGKFHSIIRELSEGWFSDEKATMSDAAKEMAAFILGSGAFGSMENRTSAGLNKRAVRQSEEKTSKTKMILKMVFPDINHIKFLYPAVKKCALLYPVFVAFRWLDILFFRTKEIKKLSVIAATKQESVDAFAEHCQKMGLSKEL